MSAVSEVMSSKKTITVSIETDPSAIDVTKLMIKNEVGSVIVVDSGDNPIGIITERDLLKNISASSKFPKKHFCKGHHVISSDNSPDH